MPAYRSLARLPGFRDFAPGEMALRLHIFDAWRRVARRYGFREYDGPPLERLDLYVAKSGDEIAGQLYSFRDKGGREVALRPEMTPTLARILAVRSRAMPKPIRWYSLPQLFRYERSQRGRLREHFQLNVDIVGEAGVAADAEVLALAIDATRELGLDGTDFAALVNDRKLVGAVLSEAGVPSDRHGGCIAAIDRASRVGKRGTAAALTALGVSQSAVAELAELLDVGGGSLDRIARRYRSEPVQEAVGRLEEHAAILGAMGLGEYVRFDFSVVRGLAYYTGIVFELHDRAGELRAICGGGRYDRLLELVGGEPLPAVGFGMGDVVLTELLGDRGLVPDEAERCDYYVAWVEERQRAAGLALGRRLREAGRSVVYTLRDQPLGRQLKAANRAGAEAALIIGPEEAETGEVTVRDLRTGEQAKRTVDRLLESATTGGTLDRQIDREGS